MPGISPGQQVVLDGQMPEAVTPFHYLDQTPLDDVGGVEGIDPLAGEGDRPLRHLAAFGPQQVGNRL